MSTSRWATPARVHAAIRRRWDDLTLLRAYARGAGFPTIAVPLQGPAATQLGANLAAAQEWAAILEVGAREGRHYNLEYIEIGGRAIGRNRLPSRAIVSRYEQAWAMLGVADDVARFDQVRALVADHADAAAWVSNHPLQAIAHHDTWPQLLTALVWLRDSARGRALREIDAPGIDTKFVEGHRRLLADILGVRHSGVGFGEDLGLRPKPQLLRMRFEPGFLGLPGSMSEAAFRLEELADVRMRMAAAVVVENETTYLSIPIPDNGIVLWGKGFDVDRVGRLQWLTNTPLHYWGDLDTHGFAILDRLRAWHPGTRSFLMDRATLLAHRNRWGFEPKPTTARLTRLTADEATLYDALVIDRFAAHLRLEQERLDWRWVLEHLPYAA